MARLPTTAERVVRDFATTMGLSAREAADGTYSFRFERGDVLTFTAGGDGTRVLISLAFQPSRADEGTEAEAMAAARIDPTTDRLIHAGRASDGTLVLAIAAPTDQLDLPVVDAALQELRSIRSALG